MTSRAQDVAIYLSNHFQQAWESFGFFDLQRLLYLAQGWHLATGRGPLFSETIGAHRSAPLTYTVKGLLPMHEMLPHPVLAEDDEDFLETFCRTYGVADRGAVQRQVDREDGAWRLAQGCVRRVKTVLFHHLAPKAAVQHTVQRPVQTAVHTRGAAIAWKGFD